MSESERLETAWRHARELAGALDLLASIFGDRSANQQDADCAALASMLALLQRQADAISKALKNQSE